MTLGHYLPSGETTRVHVPHTLRSKQYLFDPTPLVFDLDAHILVILTICNVDDDGGHIVPTVNTFVSIIFKHLESNARTSSRITMPAAAKEQQHT